MTVPAGIGTDTAIATAAAAGAAATAVATPGTPASEPDYKALYEAATGDVEKWKHLSRQHEKRAKDNADAGQTAAQRQAALDKVLAALGVEATGNKAPDVDAITAQLKQAQESARAREVELAVLRIAGRSGADGDALLDSRTFLTSLDGVEPTDTTAITDAVKAAVTANARYALAPAGTAGTGTPGTTPARQASSTGDFNGAPGGQRQWTEADVQRATPAQLRKATTDGLLTQYLGS